jgi:hypothetical protein
LRPAVGSPGQDPDHTRVNSGTQDLLFPQLNVVLSVYHHQAKNLLAGLHASFGIPLHVLACAQKCRLLK